MVQDVSCLPPQINMDDVLLAKEGVMLASNARCLILRFEHVGYLSLVTFGHFQPESCSVQRDMRLHSVKFP